MDYEVFMLCRIKERYHATGDNRLAVAQGLQASAKTISSAALIMVAVFAIFAGTGVPQIKEIGVGLAVAIFLDATIVRLILVPTTMEMMGDWNWWLPKWLDRILPDMDFESSGSEAAGGGRARAGNSIASPGCNRSSSPAVPARRSGATTARSRRSTPSTSARMP